MRWWFAFSFGWGALIGLIGTLLMASSYTHAVQDAARYHRTCARPAAAVAISACRYGPALLIDAESMPTGFKRGKAAYATLRLPDGRTRSISMETDALEALHVVPAVAEETPGPGVPVTIQTWGGRIMLIAVAGHVVRTTDNPDARVRNTMEGLALFGGAALVFGALCLYVIRQGARRRRPRDPLQPAIVGGILVLLWLLANLVIPIIALVNGHWLFGMFWAVCWAAALWPGRKSRRGEPATPSPVETVVPPRGELPRTFTEPMRTLNEREYRRSVNAAALLYVCGWLPGVIANWRLRRRYHLWAGVNEQKLPWAGLVEFQFWAFTVTLPLLALLVCLLALLGRTGASPGPAWRPPRPKTGLASPVPRSSSGTPSVSVIGINDPGQVVGNVVNASGNSHAASRGVLPAPPPRRACSRQAPAH